MSEETSSGSSHIGLAADIVAAYIGNNHVQATELPALIQAVHAALTGLADGTAGSSEPAVDKPTPAHIRRSITHDALISFEDGKPYKTLKRHLTLRGLSPEGYREKWGLPRDYPMTAASYSEARSALAKTLGLGRIGSRVTSEPVTTPEPEVPKKARGRKAKEAAAE